MGRGDLSDAEWELIGPLLPPERGRWARPAGDNRRFLNGMLHVLRTGCPWRLGCAAANAGRPGVNRRLAAHDRQHQRSRPRIGSGRKRGAVKNALGRSRGGFTSKIHARCDNQGLPLGFILTGGEASDYTAAEPLMEIPVTTPKALLADKGYDGDRFRESLLIRGILPIIPPRSNRKVPEHPDYRRYRDRNRVERMFGKLKQQRRIATRYDKTVLSFESFLNLAAVRLWLKSFVNTT
jgi:transposase